MIELIGSFFYTDWDNNNIPYQRAIIEKDLKINYPENTGIVKEDNYLYMTNTYLVKKTLTEMFFGVDLEIDIKTAYYYELDRYVLSKVVIDIKNTNQLSKFLRKNKIRNLIESDI